MATFFDSLPRQFSDVNVLAAESGIETLPFLQASEGLTRMFDTLGSAFSVVKSDVQGNITSATLQSLVEAEKAENKNTATVGLLWLKRALEFTALGLRRNVDNPGEELSASFHKAYDATLSKHHTFMVRGVFSASLFACPSRADFYKKLAGSDPNKMQGQLASWLGALENQVRIIDQFLRAKGIEK
ncbi:hypothetical protein HK105_206848 [Polyrhizophydium stewartii]|uniref:Glycolipid transfer protein domain-containing protein n=1 Tax=Polyrhizophydium stewartii TaxID=2732419 RepID=A0ABR4N2D5_9FUNG